MPIKWYAPLPKPSAEVKLTNDNITFPEAGIAKLRSIDAKFETTDYVKLGWDPDARLVVIAPTAGAPDAFKFGRRGRSLTSRTVNAGKFFTNFGIASAEATLAESVVLSYEGVASFALNLGGAPTKRRRGRRPKSQPGT